MLAWYPKMLAVPSLGSSPTQRVTYGFHRIRRMTCSTLTRVEPNATHFSPSSDQSDPPTCSTLTRVEPNATEDVLAYLSLPCRLAVPSLGSSPTQRMVGSHVS